MSPKTLRNSAHRQFVGVVGVALLGLTMVVGLLPGSALAAGTLPGAAAPAAAASAWKLQAGPAATIPSGQLTGVSCASASDCTAVGDNGADYRPFVERWNGTNWKVTFLPIPVGATGVQLSGISCPTAAFCVAVGQAMPAQTRAVILVRNASGWHLAPLPAAFSVPGVNVGLTAVSCSSAVSCMAVGSLPSAAATRDEYYPRTPAAVSWDGKAWTAVPVPWTTALAGTFRGVSCTAPAACMAVGEYSFTVPGPRLPLEITGALSRRWDGTRWTSPPWTPAAGHRQHADSGLLLGADFLRRGGRHGESEDFRAAGGRLDRRRLDPADGEFAGRKLPAIGRVLRRVGHLCARRLLGHPAGGDPAGRDRHRTQLDAGRRTFRRGGAIRRSVVRVGHELSRRWIIFR